MVAMDPVTILLSIITFLFLVIFAKKQNQGVNTNFLPGTKPLPFIGNILKIDMSKSYRTFEEMSKENGTVFSVQIGMSKMAVLCGLETIKDALINHVDDFLDRPKTRMFSRTMKDHGKPFNNLNSMDSAVANIIVAILLSCRFDYDELTILKLLLNIVPLLIHWLPGAHRKIFANIEEFHSFLETTFTRQKKELDVNDQQSNRCLPCQATRGLSTFTMELISLLLSAVVILFLAKVFKNQKKYKYSNFPPGPKPLPIIGNLHIISSLKPQKSFVEISKKYGSVFSIQLGTEKMVVLCGYDAVKDALINHAEEFAGRPVTAIGSRTSRGYGIIFSNGENWKVMRRFTLSTLRDFGMGKKTTEDKIIEECECLMKKFTSYGGKPFNNQTIMNAAVANIIVSILMDQRFDYDDPTILKLMRLVNENIRIAGSTMVRLYNSYPWLIRWLPGDHRKIFENIKNMRNFVTDTFTRKEKELDINNQRNLIDAFLVKQKEGKPESTLYYHNENLNVLVSNLFAAGMETTSTTLRWGLLLMMKYPEIQKKVQSEIENVIGSAQPQVEHRKKMPYTDAVIHEIQRYGDIVPGSVPHATTKDMTFRGYFLPKGTVVIPLLHSVLRDKAYFEKPEEFYPGHFLDSDGRFKKNEAFIPFSLGKRSCAGENLANMEIFMFFTTLLQNFTFQALPDAELDLSPAPGFTNAPLPHEICAIPRR